MNKKQKDRDGDNDKDDGMIEPIPPKFCANWTQVVRFDRIVMNVSGKRLSIQIVSTK
jgi:hypothetical protein